MTESSTHSSTASSNSDSRPPETLGLFEGIGVEVEHMIVDEASLDVKPICDQLLRAQAGQITDEIEFDAVHWSNELALHVVELKTASPHQPLDSLAQIFTDHLGRMRTHLRDLSARLMPAAMHPWMDPHTQMRLWPHAHSPIYEAFNRIFDCRGHGWANLQSTHINFPFKNDDEFGRLHAAIRILLPLLPALAASSPVMDGRLTGALDNRLLAYRANCARIPRITGRVVPEPIFTIDQYHEQLLQPMYDDIAPFDEEGTLQDEWLNARGAIARFDRNAIEIRVIDVQETPFADVAIVALVQGAMQLLVNETLASSDAQRAVPMAALTDSLERTVRDADQAVVDDADYLAVLGLTGPTAAADVWRHIRDAVDRAAPDALAFCRPQLDTLLAQGPLARRIVNALRDHVTDAALGVVDHQALHRVYQQLCDCLDAGEMFLPNEPRRSGA